MKSEVKTIRLSIVTWKMLQKAKLDKDASSADKVIKELLQMDGY